MSSHTIINILETVIKCQLLHNLVEPTFTLYMHEYFSSTSKVASLPDLGFNIFKTEIKLFGEIAMYMYMSTGG